MKKDLGLYLHIPFCIQKCGYCDFYPHREPGRRKKRMYRLWKKKSEATGILQKVTGFPRFLWEEAPLPVWKRLRQSGFFRQ